MTRTPALNANPVWPIESIVDIAAYPLSDFEDERTKSLVAGMRQAWRAQGSFSLDGFLRPEALAACVGEVGPLMARESFHHNQEHNIYFTKEDPPVEAGHGARRRLSTSNHTLTCDQLESSIIHRVYEWDPLLHFLEAVLDKPKLHRMADPLARLNVMGYGEGDQIAWHFDRVEFAVTLLLQSAPAGGLFEYRRNLRTAEDPNYDGIAGLLAGRDRAVQPLIVEPGTLNVFAGFRSPHRVTPISGPRMRLVAVLGYMEKSGVTFSSKDRIQFYGRDGAKTASLTARG